jgi:hypothetical protein
MGRVGQGSRLEQEPYTRAAAGGAIYSSGAQGNDLRCPLSHVDSPCTAPRLQGEGQDGATRRTGERSEGRSSAANDAVLGLNKNHTRERLLVVLYTALVPKETTSGAP